MNCAEAKNDLGLFLRGKLSGDRSKHMRSHLASCPRCASGLGDLDRIEALVALDEAVEPSQGFDARFLARLEMHRRQQGKVQARLAALRSRVSSWGLPKQLAAAAAVAVFLALGIYLGVLRQTPLAPAGTLTEIAIAENLPLLQDMAVIRNLDILEDFDAIQNLHDNGAKPHGVQ